MSRRMRGLVGCLVAAIAVVTPTMAAIAADGSSVRQISAATWNEARGISTIAELRAASPQARRLVTTPTIELVEVRRRVPGSSSGWHEQSASKVPAGCYDVSLATTRLNVLGDVVMQATTALRNWCTNGRQITSSPTVQRSSSARWGWVPCGWDADYAGWLHTATRFGAGGDARFGAGSCAGASRQSHHDIQVHGDGTYSWSY
jgi:hypothetical protein